MHVVTSTATAVEVTTGIANVKRAVAEARTALRREFVSSRCAAIAPEPVEYPLDLTKQHL